MKKPHWFKVQDFLLLAGTGIVILLLAVHALTTTEGGLAEGHLLLSVVGVAFLYIWLRVVLDRRAYLKQFRWYPTYGFMVKAGGYNLPSDDVFDSVVWKTIQAWSRVHPNAEQIVKKEVCWVFFKKDLDEKPLYPTRMKVEGFTMAGSHTVYVDYDKPNSPIEVTAFEHELGHIIRGFATGIWDMHEHHAFTDANGLK